MIAFILDTYDIRYEDSLVEPLTSGLINSTWKITNGNKQFILQRINHNVFKKPYELAENIRMLDQFLAEQSPEYLFVAPVKNNSNEDIVFKPGDGYFRLFPFIKGSHTISEVTAPNQAFEAAFQFGKFTKLLAGFDAAKLHLTIHDFHNLTLRYHQFEESLKLGNAKRIKQSENLISEIKEHYHIVAQYEKIKTNSNIKLRVSHLDTKISNVLFDDAGKGMCVIDLDTVMPGYFFSDVGDMMRTYLSPANEEEKDFTKIEIRDDYFQAIVQGYLVNMGSELTTDEKELVFYAGLFLIFMQAVRFLTDYFNDDSYYGSKYEGHNFVRAGNQLHLLKRLEDKREVFQKIISHELACKQ